MNLLYFGRLDTEKGWEAIIEMIAFFGTKTNPPAPMSPPPFSRGEKSLPFVLHIFGEGEYEGKIRKLAEQFPEYIIYYGFQPLDVIQKTADQCDYCLMPSLFLETFGLSALTALQRGLPVIGYKKGGMLPFVLNDYDLGAYGGSPTEQLVHMIQKVLTLPKTNNHTSAIFEKYSTKEWLTNFRQLATRGQQHVAKILLVTDFSCRLGGIETYVYDVQKILIDAGYDVEICAGICGKSRFSRYIGMLLSRCNIFFAYTLHKKIKKINPDIIRYHSVLRYTGWLPLRTAKSHPAQKRMMYHDLGYFHPQARKVYAESDLPQGLSRGQFRHAKQSGLLARITKWVMLKLLYHQLKHIDLHLVPSAFMAKYVRSFAGTTKVSVLEHFVQQ